MFGTGSTRRGGTLVGLLLASASAQTTLQWVADLGDAVRGEAAERALLQLGEKACPPLQELLEAWDAADERGRDRLRAALRVIDLLGASAAALAPALTTIGKRDAGRLFPEVIATRASLYPYAQDDAWPKLFHGGRFHTVDADRKAATFASFVRMAARAGARRTEDADAMLLLLARDEIFVREVAAEALGRLGGEAAIEALRKRLLDRDTRPKGSDEIRHNGFAVPVEDRFRLCAAEALVRIAGDDGRSALAHATLAVLHPHRAVRLQALHALARFGPDARVAVPELLELALQRDAALATEALKALGMTGAAAGPHLLAIEQLAARAEGPVQRLASALAARLRAMGIVPAVTAAELPTTGTAEDLAAAVAALGGDDDAAGQARARVRAAGAAAWPLLVLRYRREGHTAPEPLVELLGAIGAALPEAEHREARFALASSGQEEWSGPTLSTSSGGGGMRAVERDAYARLSMGVPDGLEALAGHLADDNPGVRLVAARDLAAQRAAVAKAAATPPAGAVLLERLHAAAAGEHPEKCKVAKGVGRLATMRFALTGQIRAAAAAALLDCDVPPTQQRLLLERVMPFEDAAVVALAIERWAAQAKTATLEAAGADPRPEVAAAARAALQARGDGK